MEEKKCTNEEKLEQVSGGNNDAEPIVIDFDGREGNDTQEIPAPASCFYCRSKNIVFARFEFCKPLNQTVRVYRCKDCGREF